MSVRVYECVSVSVLTLVCCSLFSLSFKLIGIVQVEPASAAAPSQLGVSFYRHRQSTIDNRATIYRLVNALESQLESVWALLWMRLTGNT